MKSWKFLIAATTLTLVSSWSILAQTPNNVVLGTWKLNVAKSTFSPGPAPKSQTRIYESTPDGTKLTLRTATASGEVVSTGTYKLDGKPYPYSGSPDFDAIAVTPVSDMELTSNLMRSGKIVGHLSRVLSTDHKTLTVHETLTSASGSTVTETAIYDRQ
jgi:hypothetical protein